MCAFAAPLASLLAVADVLVPAAFTPAVEPEVAAEFIVMKIKAHAYFYYVKVLEN